MCLLPTVVARSSSGGIAIRYVLPVLWMASYLRIISCVKARRYIRLQRVTTPRRRAQANATVASYWLRRVLNDDWTSPSCKGCPGRSLQLTVALFNVCSFPDDHYEAIGQSGYCAEVEPPKACANPGYQGLVEGETDDGVNIKNEYIDNETTDTHGADDTYIHPRP